MSIIAVFNQKGGVGRTTTALNVVAAIARRGQRPLAIDLDPQAQLSRFLGTRPKLASESVCSFFATGRPLPDVAQITRSGIALCPSHPDLGKVAAALGKGMSAITLLREALSNAALSDGAVVIDTPRSLDVMTLNALFACDLLLVPISSDFLALESAREVERAVNALEPAMKRRLPRRYLLTRYDDDDMSARVAAQMASAFPAETVCATRVRESAELAESPLFELDVFRHAPKSSGAQDYEALVDELASSGFVAAHG